MSCKTVSDRPLPRRLDRRAGRGSASKSAWSSLGGLILVLSSVGCLSDQGSPEDGPEVAAAKINALTSGTLHDEHCTTADQTQLQSFGVYASQWLNLGDGVRFSGGNVGVRDPNAPPGSLDFQLKLGQFARIDLTKTVTANYVRLETGSKVGTLRTTIGELDRQGTATHGALSAFPDSTPIPPVVAPVTVPNAASADITVAADASPSPYTAGDYRIVTVREGGTLQLAGGNYNFRSLTVGQNAKLLANASTTITVNELIIIRANARVAPAAGLTAKDLIIRSAAGDQGTDPDGEIPAIFLGPNSVTRALIVAPQAYVLAANFSRLRGALIARSALWTQGNPNAEDPAAVIYEDGIPGEACNPYDCSTIEDDGNPCTNDTCTPEWGQTHDPKSDGTICDDNGQDGACLAGECTGICNEQTQLIKGNPKLEYMATSAAQPTPSGKWLVRYVSGCMKYNPLWWWSVNGTENGEFAWYLVEDDKRQILPGTFGFFNSNTTPNPQTKPGFKEFADCVSANQTQATPLVVDHAGNDRLRIYLSDHPYTDNRHGLLGQNPTWSITPFVCNAQ